MCFEWTCFRISCGGTDSKDLKSLNWGPRLHMWTVTNESVPWAYTYLKWFGNILVCTRKHYGLIKFQITERLTTHKGCIPITWRYSCFSSADPLDPWQRAFLLKQSIRRLDCDFKCTELCVYVGLILIVEPVIRRYLSFRGFTFRR